MRDVAVICGPTAAGKSALALALAERTGALLVSADSRQVVRRFDLGTAKPTPDERARVPHRGLDLVDPTERYSAARFAADVPTWLAEADALGRPVVVVGGTGFYLRALETPLFEAPPLDDDARRALESELAPLPVETLRARVAVLDPPLAHLGRTQLLRAIEVATLTGTPLSTWQRTAARPATMRLHHLVVDPGDRLRTRIEARVHAMLDAGWEREVAALLRDIPADAPAWNACGYDLLRRAALGELSRAAAIERTVIDTRQYAKRQRTWFRHQLPETRTVRLDPTAGDAFDRVMAWWHSLSVTESA
ncbi:MAG: tRNA (adenosine(37)-N6)-dimethylallyltransferase MiaA [Gemmatimonadaceae bacterium]|nr:tRNA (adenosine(37)-N6)-dimethylallyltransferase MiaA [Gemmatimonadaceae bacterium]